MDGQAQARRLRSFLIGGAVGASAVAGRGPATPAPPARPPSGRPRRLRGGAVLPGDDGGAAAGVDLGPSYPLAGCRSTNTSALTGIFSSFSTASTSRRPKSCPECGEGPGDPRAAPGCRPLQGLGVLLDGLRTRRPQAVPRRRQGGQARLRRRQERAGEENPGRRSLLARSAASRGGSRRRRSGSAAGSPSGR